MTPKQTELIIEDAKEWLVKGPRINGEIIVARLLSLVEQTEKERDDAVEGRTDAVKDVMSLEKRLIAAEKANAELAKIVEQSKAGRYVFDKIAAEQKLKDSESARLKAVEALKEMLNAADKMRYDHDSFPTFSKTLLGRTLEPAREALKAQPGKENL